MNVTGTGHALSVGTKSSKQLTLIKKEPRVPSPTETTELHTLQWSLQMHFDLEKHEGLLQKLWYLLHPSHDHDDEEDAAEVEADEGQEAEAVTVVAEDLSDLSFTPGASKAVEKKPGSASSEASSAQGQGFGSASHPEYKSVGTEWCSFGFQQEDPTKDIRGGGLLSVEQLIFFLETHRQAASFSLAKQQAASSSRGSIMRKGVFQGYPWAAAGINITRKIALLFSLVNSAGSPLDFTTTQKNYWHLVDEIPELYCIMFRYLDVVWDEMGGNYMLFNSVLNEVHKRLEAALNQGPDTVHDLCIILDLESETDLEVVKGGFMEKQPQDAKTASSKGWKKRYFTLTQPSPVRIVLSYYASQKESEQHATKCKGRFVLVPETQLSRIGNDILLLKNELHSMQLKAPSQQAATDWLEVLQNGIDQIGQRREEQNQSETMWLRNPHQAQNDQESNAAGGPDVPEVQEHADNPSPAAAAEAGDVSVHATANAGASGEHAASVRFAMPPEDPSSEADANPPEDDEGATSSVSENNNCPEDRFTRASNPGWYSSA